MFKYLPSLSAKQLIAAWNHAGLVKATDTLKLENFLVTQQQEKTPLYLQVFMGIGGLVATLCFLGFLIFTSILDLTNTTCMVTGIILMILAYLLFKLFHNAMIQSSFLPQLSLSFMGVGKLLFVFGFANHMNGDSFWSFTWAILLVTLPTYYFYPVAIDRFLSTLAFFISFLISLMLSAPSNSPIIFNIYFCAQLILFAILFLAPNVRSDFRALAYATALALCSNILFTQDYLLHYDKYLVFLNILLTVYLLGLIAWATGNIEKLKTKSLMLAILAVLLLGLISAPGILLALSFMILGYARHEKPLLIIGILFSPLFIFFYYYNLDVNLMTKAGILISSGFVLLISHLWLAHQLARKA